MTTIALSILIGSLVGYVIFLRLERGILLDTISDQERVIKEWEEDYAVECSELPHLNMN